MQPLLVVGTGGFGRETVEVVRAINEERPTWELVGFLDDDPALHGVEVEGLPVLGPSGGVDAYPRSKVVVSIGNPSNYFSRKRIVRRLGLEPSRYATLVHPAAVVPRSAQLGPGTVLLAGVVATSRIRLGAHVVVMPAVVLTHDDEVEDYATFASGVRLGGRVRVGEGAYLGAGALVREDRTVGPWALVGMGAVVTRDIPAREVWAGVPAAPLRRVEVPADVAEAR